MQSVRADSLVEHYAGLFNRRVGLAAGSFGLPAAGKARRRPPRPDTSPLVELYADWERRARGALMAHWGLQARRLTERLRADVKAADNVLGDGEWWEEWTGAYLVVLLPFLEEAGGVGTAAGAAALEEMWALGVELDETTLAVADWARAHAGRLAKGLTKTDKGLLRRHLAAWVESDEDLPALVKRVDSFLNNLPRARRIAVTEATGAYAEGNLIVWRQSEVVTGKIWNTAQDELVCPICGGLDGQVTEVDGDVWRHFSRPGLSVGLSVAAPPAHPNCILPDNVVAVPGLSAVAKSRYAGRAIEIRTMGGRYLAVTENHPILTARGWVAAKFVDEGEQIVAHLRPKRVASSVNPYYDHVPAVAEQVFGSFKMAAGVSAISVPVAAKDFHGDGWVMDGDVEIVGANSFLMGNAKAAFMQPIAEPSLVGSDELVAFSLPCSGTLRQFSYRGAAATHGGVGSGCELSPFCGRHALHSEFIGLGNATGFNASLKQTMAKSGAIDASLAGKFLLWLTGDVALNEIVKVGNLDAFGHFDQATTLGRVAGRNAGLQQAVSESAFAYPGLTGEFHDRFTGFVALDEVVEVRYFDFSGHVYDLQSDLCGLYTSNGIIVKNCRCWPSPFVGEIPGLGLSIAPDYAWGQLMGRDGISVGSFGPGAWR